MPATTAEAPLALAFARLHRADDEGAARLLARAWTTVLGQVRDGDLRPLRVQLVAAMHTLSDASAGEHVAPPAHDLGDPVAALCNAVARLGHEHREILLLRDVGGWQLDEVASALGLGLDDARRRLGAARSALARAL